MLANYSAFLSMVSHAEGTDRALDPYRVCYAFRHTIADLTWHPAEHRPPVGAQEWKGESLDSLGGIYVGQISTAAGRYQIRLGVWRSLKSKLRLANFSAASQDDAALDLIKERGALPLIARGDIAGAVAACSGIWASLPGSAAGQPQRPLAALLGAYAAAGGALAGSSPA